MRKLPAPAARICCPEGPGSRAAATVHRRGPAPGRLLLIGAGGGCTPKDRHRRRHADDLLPRRKGARLRTGAHAPGRPAERAHVVLPKPLRIPSRLIGGVNCPPRSFTVGPGATGKQAGRGAMTDGVTVLFGAVGGGRGAGRTGAADPCPGGGSAP